MTGQKRFFFFFIFVVAGALSAHAQLTLRPLGATANQRILSEEDTVALPFWDDFSGTDPFPDSSKWQGIDSRISRTLGIRPPSLGVAVFDGITFLGTPHNATTQFVGPADSLSSKFIDLEGIPESQKPSVWLSFFWQLKGNGEIPDMEDSLRLQFYDVEGNWSTVWSLTGGLDNQKDDFEQVLIQLNRQEYFHAGFRFRFQSFNRLTGPFDTFFIDYVYLNEGRSILDNVYFDRALTSLPSYTLDGYSAIPMTQFRSSPQSFITPPSVGFYNLDNQIQPIEYNAYISRQETGEVIDSLNSQTVVNPVPGGLERRVFVANEPNTNEWPLEEDSLNLTTTFFITSGDDIIDGINYRVNDTIRTSFVLDDYFAYDDGTAEFAAGINQSRGQLAIQYFAPESDFLTDVDIYFPQIFPLSNGQPIELLVMKDLTGEVGSILAKQSFISQFGASIDEFVSYKFETPVLVSDTFFIGFQQFTDNFIGIGLDKNTDTGNKVFANVGGDWEQNTTVPGSLMIRPKFARISSTVTSIDEELINQLRIYPNPAQDQITIESIGLDRITLMNITGQELFMINQPRNRETLSLAGLSAGIYLVKLTLGQQQVTRKIILR
ncbi:MAG: T9SS type A sorting domain-containing protein [Cyclobacteriaceae bacterium]